MRPPRRGNLHTAIMQDARCRGLSMRRAFCIYRAVAQSAFTLLEVLFALTLTALVGAVAAPELALRVDDVRAAGAARYIATRLQQSRAEAIVRSTAVGWQFVATPEGYQYAPYADGNGNGVRSQDILQSIDAQIGPVERLPDRFAGIDFGAMPALPAVDSGGTAPGADPIRLGASHILTFTPLGTSSSGSLYLRGRRDIQYAICAYGVTGKVRIVKYNAGTRRWGPA